MNFIFDVGTNGERTGIMVKSSCILDGRAINRSHNKPSFDTCEYEIEFTDGTRNKCAANLIKENIYVPVDDEGHKFQLLEEIQDHRKDRPDISKEEGHIRSANGTERDKITTRGW